MIVLIWAGAYSEAFRYARKNNLERGEWRFVSGTRDVVGLRDFEIKVLRAPACFNDNHKVAAYELAIEVREHERTRKRLLTLETRTSVTMDPRWGEDRGPVTHVETDADMDELATAEVGGFETKLERRW